METQQLARGLGWFSIGLGAAELFAPKQLGQLIGVNNHKTLIRMMGVREIAAGIGVLAEDRPTNSMTARVSGDALDLALLGAGLVSSNSNKGRVIAATAAVAGVTALDILCRKQLSNGASASTNGHKRSIQTVAINRSPEECYKLWRDFANLPRFMQHVESVQVLDDRRSHWVVRGPGGSNIEWDAEITDDRPNETIAWRSVEGSDVNHSGRVRFERAPAGHGTFVKVRVSYETPGGKLGSIVAKVIGKDPSQLIQGDLRRFKSIIETGEIPSIEGQPSGPRSAVGRALEVFDRA
jgi:uncharacterized membrane protein